MWITSLRYSLLCLDLLINFLQMIFNSNSWQIHLVFTNHCNLLRYSNLHNFILYSDVSQACSIHESAGITDSLRKMQRIHSHAENQKEYLMN